MTVNNSESLCRINAEGQALCYAKQNFCFPIENDWIVKNNNIYLLEVNKDGYIDNISSKDLSIKPLSNYNNFDELFADKEFLDEASLSEIINNIYNENIETIEHGEVKLAFLVKDGENYGVLWGSLSKAENDVISSEFYSSSNIDSKILVKEIEYHGRNALFNENINNIEDTIDNDIDEKLLTDNYHIIKNPGMDSELYQNYISKIEQICKTNNQTSTNDESLNECDELYSFHLMNNRQVKMSTSDPILNNESNNDFNSNLNNDLSTKLDLQYQILSINKKIDDIDNPYFYQNNFNHVNYINDLKDGILKAKDSVLQNQYQLDNHMMQINILNNNIININTDIGSLLDDSDTTRKEIDDINLAIELFNGQSNISDDLDDIDDKYQNIIKSLEDDINLANQELNISDNRLNSLMFQLNEAISFLVSIEDLCRIKAVDNKINLSKEICTKLDDIYLSLLTGWNDKEQYINILNDKIIELNNEINIYKSKNLNLLSNNQEKQSEINKLELELSILESQCDQLKSDVLLHKNNLIKLQQEELDANSKLVNIQNIYKELIDELANLQEYYSKLTSENSSIIDEIKQLKIDEYEKKVDELTNELNDINNKITNYKNKIDNNQNKITEIQKHIYALSLEYDNQDLYTDFLTKFNLDDLAESVKEYLTNNFKEYYADNLHTQELFYKIQYADNIDQLNELISQLEHLCVCPDDPNEYI